MQIFDFIQVSGQELSIYDGARLFWTGPGDYQETFRQPIVVRYRGAVPTVGSLPAAAIHVDVTMCDFSRVAIGYPHGPGAAISCRWRENLNLLQEIDYMEYSMRAKFYFLLCLMLCVSLAFAGPRGSGAPVAVRGYVKKDGTYVQPHMRSAPDGNFSNNWSTVGNVNPYTGAAGTKTTPSSSSPESNSASVSPAPEAQSGISLVPGTYSPNAEPISGSASAAQPAGHSNSSKLPPHAKLNYLGNDWECVRGYYRAAQQCVAVALPPNTKLNYLGNGWECVPGYRQSGQECVAVKLPANAKLNYLGNGWECQRGYRQSGQECVIVGLPMNAKLNYLGNGWECQHGYRQSVGECIAVALPPNTKLNYLGNGWECVRGYRQSGQECIAVELPVNAKLNYLGNGWECQRGYRQSVGECVAVR